MANSATRQFLILAALRLI